MIDVIRGCRVFFSVQFFSNTGGLLSPADASVTVSAHSDGEVVEEVVLLVLDTGYWRGTLETIDLDAGTVYWSARAGGLDRATEDGQLRVLANAANEMEDA